MNMAEGSHSWGLPEEISANRTIIVGGPRGLLKRLNKEKTGVKEVGGTDCLKKKRRKPPNEEKFT